MQGSDVELAEPEAIEQWNFNEQHDAWALEKQHSISSDTGAMLKAAMTTWPPEYRPELSSVDHLDASFKFFSVLVDIGMSPKDITLHAAVTWESFADMEDMLKAKLRPMDFIKLRGALRSLAGVAPKTPAIGILGKQKSSRQAGGGQSSEKRARVSTDIISRMKEVCKDELALVKTAEDKKRMENFVVSNCLMAGWGRAVLEITNWEGLIYFAGQGGAL